MEQATRKRAHLERILLVCGEQNAGKSRLLRYMLGDLRLGGEVPSSARVGQRSLSRERRLAIRFTSPHERGETPTEFHRKIDRECELAWNSSVWRINYACAVQSKSYNKMPGIVDLCDGLNRAFMPERIRVVQLFPNQWGSNTTQISDNEVDSLRKIDVELVTIDARRSSKDAEPGNVRVMADYFDFS